MKRRTVEGGIKKSAVHKNRNSSTSMFMSHSE